MVDTTALESLLHEIEQNEGVQEAMLVSRAGTYLGESFRRDTFPPGKLASPPARPRSARFRGEGTRGRSCRPWRVLRAGRHGTGSGLNLSGLNLKGKIVRVLGAARASRGPHRRLPRPCPRGPSPVRRSCPDP